MSRQRGMGKQRAPFYEKRKENLLAKLNRRMLGDSRFVFCKFGKQDYTITTIQSHKNVVTIVVDLN